MAQKVVTQLVDDIDGTVLEEGSGETVEFTLDGSAYAIDLSQDNATQLREVFGSYIAAGRRLSNSKARVRGGVGSTNSRSGPPASEIREWARSTGYDVPATGRIPRNIREAFDRR
ncbi:MAG: Lsr2 family protein [Ornithinimicrobium sp.]